MSTNETRKPVDPNAVSERYLFETCFDSDRIAGNSPDDAPEPTFTEEDLETSRQAAYAEGQATGRQDAVNSLEKQLLNGLGRLVEQMLSLSDDQMRFQQDLTERSVELALKATRKMFPALAQRDGLIEIDALLTNCLLEAREDPRIMVRVSSALAEPYRERIDALAAAAGYQGAVTVLADDTFGPADCRVEWTDGGAERVAEQMWLEFDAATQRIFCDPVDDGEDDQQALPEAQVLPDDAIQTTLGEDSATRQADGPDALNGYADRDAPMTVDLTAETLPEPIPNTIPEPMDEAMDELTGEAVTEATSDPADRPTSEFTGEPVPGVTEEPCEEQVEEPTETPTGTPAELPTQPDDAATDLGMTPEADPPQHPATAS